MSRNVWLGLLALFALLLLGLGLGLGLGLSGRMTGSPTLPAAEIAHEEPPTAADPLLEPAAADSQALPIPPTLDVPATATEPPTSTATPSPTSVPSETPQPSETPLPTDTPTATPTDTTTPTPTASITPTREGPVAETNADAGFFAGPGVEYGRANYFAKKGEILVLLGKSSDDSWVHVISNANSFEGWVSSRFLKLLSGSIADLTLSTYRGAAVTFAPTAGAETPAAAGPASGTASFAYLEGSGAGNGDGTWSGELLVKVPTGYSYTFELPGAYNGGARRSKENEGGFDEYVLPLIVRCGGAFIGDLQVFQNGAQMSDVRNLYTGQDVAVYIPLDCD